MTKARCPSEALIGVKSTFRANPYENSETLV
jgi:hypothetical protein